MTSGTNLLVLLAMVVGTVGVVLPVLPGLLVVWGAAVVWALLEQSTTGWVVLGVATLVYAAGLVGQYLVPGRRMQAAGVRSGVVVAALVVGVLGFFVVPVVGGPLGFVGTVYVAERVRRREHAAAWRATLAAIRAVGLGIGIELLTALGIMTTWLVGVWVG